MDIPLSLFKGDVNASVTLAGEGKNAISTIVNNVLLPLVLVPALTNALVITPIPSTHMVAQTVTVNVPGTTAKMEEQ